MSTCRSLRHKESRRTAREYEEQLPYLLLAEPSGGEADPPEAASCPRRAGQGDRGSERQREAALESVRKEHRAEHRAALVLRHMEGLSYAQIAEVLEVPDGQGMS